ncbi:TVP38/TMEM64 family protein [Calycomorphotria hydatis]|uniref:TVP38/TMEM64 family membrane protein n=1 Tax=Calycomorphotria hydatis TaxID=2528027 RepID=A0A517TEL6_9PLAN|nr:VTT domain-containing protein [Calycomorphotria hydatis]QDT66817.1 SNARE associated Golgi protein [Calycomorphotria hydatis]
MDINSDTPDSVEDASEATPPRSPRSGLYKIALLAGVAIAFGVIYFLFGEYLQLETLAGYEAALLSYGESHLTLTITAAILIYAVVTGLSIPGALVLTIAYGWYFSRVLEPTLGGVGGIVGAIAIVSVSSTSGATIGFLLSRYLLRDTIQQRFPRYVEKFDRAIRDEGPFYLFSLRLFPGAPFFVVNLAMGLTPINTLTYWWVSQLGMLPGTSVYVYGGAQVPTLAKLADDGVTGLISINLLIALAVLALFPLALKLAYKFFVRKPVVGEAEVASEQSS